MAKETPSSNNAMIPVNAHNAQRHVFFFSLKLLQFSDTYLIIKQYAQANSKFMRMISGVWIPADTLTLSVSKDTCYQRLGLV